MNFSNRENYFIILIGRKDEFYDRSGSAFVIMLMIKDDCLNIDALGIYPDKGKPEFGRVPEKTYIELLSNSLKDSDVILRLRVTPSQYSDCLSLIQDWERRVNESALLYNELSMNNLLFVKQVTECINRNNPIIKLYKLDWGLEDHISEYNPPALIPYLYFKELRQLNNDVHVKDDQFQQYMQAVREKY